MAKRSSFSCSCPAATVDPSQYVRGGEPHIDEVRVVGDFQSALGGTDWDHNAAPLLTKNPHPNGVLYSFKTPSDLPDGFYQYKGYA